MKYGFQNDWIDSTLVTHYHLICEDSGAIKNAKSMQMLGFFLAAVIQANFDQIVKGSMQFSKTLEKVNRALSAISMVVVLL